MGAAAHTTSGLLGGSAPLTSDATLPKLRLIDLVSAEDLQAEALEVIGRVRLSTERARAVLVAGTYARGDILALQADLNGAVQDLRALRSTLDTWRAIDHLVVIDGAALIQLWVWERGIRRQISRMLVSIQSLYAVLSGLAPGDLLRTYVTHSDDTWQSIAQRELGDWSRWGEIVELNGGDPASLSSGVELRLPRR